MNVVSIKGMTKSYGKYNVLDNLDWTVEKGDIVALLGKNGAGKSTLLESVMNLRSMESGELLLWNKKWSELPQKKREKIGFVAQDTVGFEWMKAGDFLTYLGGIFATFDMNYCNQLRENWNLDANKRVGELSGGQTQILHVIQALSIRPDLLVLDEPVAHLDPVMRRQFISELVDQACDNETTVIFSSHIISDLERVANKVALLKDGKISRYHDVEALKSSIARLKINANEDIQNLEYYKNLSHWYTHDNGATALITSPLAVPLSQFIDEAPNPIETMPMTLEDWYLEVNHEAA